MKSFIKFLGSSGGKWLMTIFFGAIIFLVSILILGQKIAVPDGVIVVFAVLWVILGWRQISRIIPPELFLFLGSAGKIFYFVLKLGAAIIFGLFILPYVIGKFISTSINKAVGGD